MRLFYLALSFLAFSATAFSADVDYSKLSNEALIGRLALTDADAQNIDDTAIFGKSAGNDSASRAVVVGSEIQRANGPMRELVRRGPNALHALIRHLRDARATKLSLERVSDLDTVGGNYFSNEYDARDRMNSDKWGCHPCLRREIKGHYIVKIGDICYALIGDIVNRDLLAERYQPTAIIIVNSPVKTPELADHVRRDWGSATPNDLRQSLLSDLRDDELAESAFVRLRFYFPETYQALDGADAVKRAAFEAKEASGH